MPAILAATLAMAVSLGLWRAVEQDRQEKVARIAEGVSWGSRSELVQRVDIKLHALRQLADFWARFGRLPRDQWTWDVQIELSHFHGMRVIAWSDPEHGVRFYTSSPEPVFDREPSEEEWDALGAALVVAHRQEAPTMVGPTEGEEGHAWYHVYVPVRRAGESRGVLIAVIDAHETLAELLRDEAPGYAVTVSWDGVPLYQQDEPAPEAPEAWTREGWIQLFLGPRWKVTHRPTRQLAADLASPAVAAMPLLGLFVSGLIGALVLARARAQEGARAARGAEAEVRRLNAELEGRVADRTAELEAAVADLELFNQSVSHDLRSPLSTIVIQAELLRDEAVERSEVVTALGRISGSAGRMTETLDHLLCFARASRDALATETVDVARLAADAFQELRAREERGGVVEWVLGELPPAEADPVLTSVLLTNLIGNALKFTRGRPRRRIAVGFDPGREGGAYFVRDDGPGFAAAAAEAERIFRPFQRGSNSGGVPGSGLGLAIAERIVRRHGGRIWAESSENGGATFYFTLPAASSAG